LLARRWLAEYAKKSNAADMSEELLSVQARRAALIKTRLGAGTALLLPDPVGTGKTAVTLVAAGMLLEAGAIRRVLVVVPNAAVKKVWQDRIKWLVSPVTRRPLAGKPFRVVTRKQLSTLRKPVKPHDILVVVDEAHRGLQAEGEFHERLERWSSGCQVLLVTATPFLLSSQGLMTMLKVGKGTGDNGRAPVEAYGASVTTLAREYRAAVLRSAIEPTSEPAVVAAVEEAAKKKAAAQKVLRQRILAPDHGLDRLRGHPPTLKRDALDVSREWQEAYHVARVIPELVGTGKGDMFNRRLLSCSEAFWSGTAGRALRKKATLSEPVAAFTAELELALGLRARHPKVDATARWVASHVEQGRHVLVFCVFAETQATLRLAIEKRIAATRAASVAAPPGAQIPPATAERFRNPDADPLVLIVQDRHSESIDLDGGHPCLVHHDLPWTPARVTQRWGRVVRAGTGFKKVHQADIYVPVLKLDADIRLFDTVKARSGIGDVLLPRSVLADVQDPDEYSLPDAILDRLRAP
jgi:hypothetical protein